MRPGGEVANLMKNAQGRGPRHYCAIKGECLKRECYTTSTYVTPQENLINIFDATVRQIYLFLAHNGLNVFTSVASVVHHPSAPTTACIQQEAQLK